MSIAFLRGRCPSGLTPLRPEPRRPAEAMGRAMPSPEATASPAPTEKRQPRQSRLVKATLSCKRLGAFDVTIRNVSETGLGGQGPHVLQIGERITVLLSGHEAKIREWEFQQSLERTQRLRPDLLEGK